MDVKIYVEVAPSFGKAKNGKAMWLVSVDTIKGPATKYGYIRETDISSRRLFLLALNAALFELTKRCNVQLYIDDRFFINVMERQLIKKWNSNCYISAKGTKVKNCDLWEQLYGYMQKHTVTIDEGNNEYRSWMLTQLRRG